MLPLRSDSSRISECAKSENQCAAGGEPGVENGPILFRGGPDEPVCSLYPFALRSVVDVQLAVKNCARETDGFRVGIPGTDG
jgi:hypothetical protein